MDESTINIDDGHLHEALDRTHLAIDYLQMSLKEHPLIHCVDEFDKKVDKAINILAQLYQDIGQFESYEEVKAKLHTKTFDWEK